MTDDVIERAEAFCARSTMRIAQSLISDLVAELKAARAEVNRLQQGGAWGERDGECICNLGPDTEGPDEFCPWHGRSYNELLEGLTHQATELKAARAENERLRNIMELPEGGLRR